MIAVAATATNWTDAVSAVAAAAAALTGLLALGAVVVGSLYARGQLRAAREQRDEAKASRYAELVVGLSNQWREKELADARKLEVSFGDQAGLRRAIEEKYPTQDADYFALERIPVFFENLGILEKHRAVSLDLVQDMFGPLLADEYERWKPSINWLRDFTGEEALFGNFARLRDGGAS